MHVRRQNDLMSHQNSLCSAELYGDSKKPSTFDVRFIVFENTSNQVKKDSILYRCPDPDILVLDHLGLKLSIFSSNSFDTF